MNDPEGDEGTGGEGRRSRPRRTYRKVTPEYLESVALWYLGRFSATAGSLEKVLMKRVLRSARCHGVDPAEGRELVETLIDRYKRAGLIDDAAYAENRARALHRRGLSIHVITARLTAKGVGADEIHTAIAGLQLKEATADGDDGPDLSAARRYARRRRLGPYRQSSSPECHRQRDLAALARAGFDYATARAIIEMDDDPEGCR